MLDKANNVIKITGYDMSGDVPETLFTARFGCANCKHISSCANNSDCKFVAYIRKRIRHTKYSCDSNKMTLDIMLPNQGAGAGAFQTVKYATHLRTFHSLQKIR